MTAYFSRDAHGTRVALQLDKVIHKGGGAGRICAIDGVSHQVAKLYHDDQTAAGYEAKIRAMLTRRPDLPPIEHEGRSFVQIAWPETVIEDASGRFAGFTMPFLDLSRAAPMDMLLVKALRARNGLPENYAYRVFAAQNLAASVAELHRLGHHIIDLKPQNLSIYKQSMYVAVLDCDGLSIDAGDGKRFPGHQYTEGYLAPEAAAKRISPEQLGEEQDRFALAVVLFQLLNQGVHPFQGVPRKKGDRLGTEQERIKAGLYPYGAIAHPRQGPSPGSIHAHFEDETLELFRRAFTSRYRPSALEWREHLRELTQTEVLQRCETNPAEHAHFSRGCGLCKLEAGKQARLVAAKKRKAEPRRTARPQTTYRPTRTGRPQPSSRHAPIRRRRTVRRVSVPTPVSWGALGMGALRLGKRLGLWVKGLLFGRGATGAALPAGGTVDRALSYLFYAAFALNLVILALLFASLVSPRSFYWLPEFVASHGLLTELADMRAKQALKFLQSASLSFVLFTTVLTAVGSHALSKSAHGTICGSHGRWLAGTVWLAPLVLLAAVLVSLTWWSGHAGPMLAAPLWLIYRFAKGFFLLVQNRPLAAPGAIF